MQVTCVAYDNPTNLSNFKYDRDFDTYKQYGHDRWNQLFHGLKIISQKDIGTINRFVFDLQFNITDLKDIFNRESDRHLFNTLNVKFTTIDAVKRKQGYFLINLPTEGIYWDWFVNDLQNYFKNYNIPLSQIVYINNSANGAEICKKNKLEFRHVFAPPFIDDYAYREDFDFKGSYEDKKHTFLCYNRNLHQHRIAFYTLMHKNNLLDSCLYSMPKRYVKGTYKELGYEIVRDTDFSELGIKIGDIDYADKNLPLSIDDKFDRSLINTSPDMWTHHKESLISIVTETYFYDTTSIHITEKTFKPISFCQPFILLSTPGSLQYLKDLGFKTFDGFWAESYDSIKDNNKRMKAVLSTVKRISNWTDHMRKEFYSAVQPIVTYNKNHLQRVKVETEKLSNSIWRT